MPTDGDHAKQVEPAYRSDLLARCAALEAENARLREAAASGPAAPVEPPREAPRWFRLVLRAAILIEVAAFTYGGAVGASAASAEQKRWFNAPDIIGGLLWSCLCAISAAVVMAVVLVSLAAIIAAGVWGVRAIIS